MPATTKTPVYQPPQIPSKHDIIPIHTSDRATFKRCRRKWDWSSPMRNNLRQKVTQAGIYFPLWFGSGIHFALAQYYSPTLQRDPVEAFINWYQLQWEGGVVSEDMLEHVHDPNPRPLANDLDKAFAAGAPDEVISEGITREQAEGEQRLYEVYGLRDMHPDPISEEFEYHRDLGIGMMTFYRDTYAPMYDNFTVIVEEHQFSIPIGITAVDPRDGVKKEVHYRGRQDAIVQDNESERYGILEHKTAAKMDDDYFRKLEKDEQVTSYMYAAEVEAQEYGLDYGQIDFTLYNVLRKVYPKPPTELKNGLFSRDREKESTTIELLEQFIKERNIGIIVENDEKLGNYVDYVREQGHEQFVIRKPVYRNRHEVTSCHDRVQQEVVDMLGLYWADLEEAQKEGSAATNRINMTPETLPQIYPNPTGDFMCLNCPFRAPCIAADDGSDWRQMLIDGYEKNIDR